MFVDSLRSDDQRFMQDRGVTWDRIEEGIKALDNDRVTEISIAKLGTESHMSISGGSGSYLISSTLDNDVFYSIRNPQGDPRQKTKLVSGRQQVTVGLHEVVPLSVALAVAKTFVENGQIDQNATWLRNPPE